MHRLLLLMVSALLFSAAAPSVAAPVTLPARVERVPIEPRVRIVPRSAGHTPAERLRSPHRPLSASDSLVLVVQLDPANSPDEHRVVAARDGRTITVAIATRRFEGPLAANVVTTPYVEIELGRLPAGRIEARIDEQITSFDNNPATKSLPPRPGLQTRLTVGVR